MDRIDFPLTGNSLILAIVILIHVFFAFIAVGALTLAAYSEWVAKRKNDNDYELLSRRITKFLSDMMKVNGVLGVVIIVLLIGLWGTFTKLLYSNFFWVFVVEGSFFLLLMIFSISYNRTWDKISRNSHIVFGVLTAFAAIVSAFLINVVWAFMMTPGIWMETQSRWDAVNTPILWESFLHMLIPCLINGALFVFLWTYWKSRFSDHDLEYYQKMNKFTGKITGVLLFLQPLSGISFLLKVKSSTQNLSTPNPWQQISNGMGTTYLYTMITFAGIAVIFTILYWLLGHEKGRKFLIGTAIAVSVAFVMGGFTREKARKPYLIWGTMFMNQKMITETIKPDVKEIEKEEVKEISGELVFGEWECRACHKLQGRGGNAGPALVNLSESYEIDDLMEFLKYPPETMPSFEGPDDELRALAEYLLESSKD